MRDMADAVRRFHSIPAYDLVRDARHPYAVMTADPPPYFMYAAALKPWTSPTTPRRAS